MLKFKMSVFLFLQLAGLYSMLVNYSLWRGKLTQISTSKHYELSHFPLPSRSGEKREWKESVKVACSDMQAIQGSFLTGATL